MPKTRQGSRRSTQPDEDQLMLRQADQIRGEGYTPMPSGTPPILKRATVIPMLPEFAT
jgi:hypothetical protein